MAPRRFETMAKHPFEPWPAGITVIESADAMAVDAAQDNQKTYGEPWLAVRIEGRGDLVSFPTRMLKLLGAPGGTFTPPVLAPTPPPPAARQHLRDRAAGLVAPTRDEIKALNDETKLAEEVSATPQLTGALNTVIREVSIIQGITVGAGLRAMIDSLLKVRAEQ